jgi:hypothetical protein
VSDASSVFVYRMERRLWLHGNGLAVRDGIGGDVQQDQREHDYQRNRGDDYGDDEGFSMHVCGL